MSHCFVCCPYTDISIIKQLLIHDVLCFNEKCCGDNSVTIFLVEVGQSWMTISLYQKPTVVLSFLGCCRFHLTTCNYSNLGKLMLPHKNTIFRWSRLVVFHYESWSLVLTWKALGETMPTLLFHCNWVGEIHYTHGETVESDPTVLADLSQHIPSLFPRFPNYRRHTLHSNTALGCNTHTHAHTLHSNTSRPCHWLPRQVQSFKSVPALYVYGVARFSWSHRTKQCYHPKYCMEVSLVSLFQFYFHTLNVRGFSHWRAFNSH